MSSEKKDRETISSSFKVFGKTPFDKLKDWVFLHLRPEADKILAEDALNEFRDVNPDLTITEAMDRFERPNESNQYERDLHLAIDWEAIWEKEQNLAKIQEKAKELREALSSGEIKGEDIGLFRSETRVIRNTKKLEKALKRIEELEARLKGEAPKPPIVPPSKPEAFPTKEQTDLLEKMFINQLVIRGFSEMFAKRELEVARDDLQAEIKNARDLETAKTLVKEFAKSYFMLQGRRPFKGVKGVIPEPILPAITGAEAIPSVREQEGYSPIDGQPLIRMRAFPLRGLIWWVKDPLDLYRENEPYTVDEHGNRVRRNTKYFLWSNQEGIHREVTLDELVQRGIAVSRGIERAETNSARLYKAFLNEGKNLKVIPQLASEFSITEARANEIIQKGNAKGVLALYEDVED